MSVREKILASFAIVLALVIGGLLPAPHARAGDPADLADPALPPTTVGELVARLQEYDQNLPIKVAVGRGRMLAPVDVDFRASHAANAAGYEVLHADAAETPTTVVLFEAPRLVPTLPLIPPSPSPSPSPSSIAPATTNR